MASLKKALYGVTAYFIGKTFFDKRKRNVKSKEGLETNSDSKDNLFNYAIFTATLLLLQNLTADDLKEVEKELNELKRRKEKELNELKMRKEKELKELKKKLKKDE